MSFKPNDDTLSENAERLAEIINKNKTVMITDPYIELKGARHFSTGARRDDDTGKPKLTYIPFDLLDRPAFHLMEGAKKYGDHNYRKGIPSVEVFESLLRHVRLYYMGATDEDHLSAIQANLWFLMHNEAHHANDKNVHNLPQWWFDRGFWTQEMFDEYYKKQGV